MKKIELIILAALLLTGCMSAKKKIKIFDADFGTGKYDKAAEFALSQKDKKADIDESNLLWTLQAGAALRVSQNYDKSTALFTESEKILKYHNLESMAGQGVSATASVLINDAVLDYRGEEYDGIMSNTYKALNCIAIKNYDKARVEFNRAEERQRRARVRYSAELAKRRKSIKEKKNANFDVQKTADNPQLNSSIKQRYSNLENFRAYPDFSNPFTTYMAGLFFHLINDGDNSKSTNLLKRVYGMVPNNKYVLEDFQAADKQERQQNTVWIIFENGLGPIKEEIKINIPIFLISQKIKYIGVAFPILKMRPAAHDSLWITTSDQSKAIQTTPLASLERVVLTEFKKDLPGIITRSIISTAIKTFAQYQANKRLGALGGLGMAVYQYATTKADIRIWTALPKEFQIAKLAIPENRKISITPSGGQEFTVSIPKCNNAIVYIKIPKKNVIPAREILTFE